MTNPLVSVVIPLFNKETFISTTLQSVIAQTYAHIELIVVDDSSTDGSLALAKEMLNLHANRFANIQILSRPNTGQAGARNDGIGSANGEFIAFLDADDIWHPQKIAMQVKMLQESPHLDLVFCNYIMLFPHRYSAKAIRFVPVGNKIKSWLLTTGFGGALESTVTIRRTVLISHLGFDNKLQMCGGLDLAYRLAQSERAGCVDEYLCGYRIVPSGWHNNKSDLVNSYDELMKKNSLYGYYEAIMRLNLQIHLSLWSFRNYRSLHNLKNLLGIFTQNPLPTIKYLFHTLARILAAQIRGVIHFRRVRILRQIADL